MLALSGCATGTEQLFSGGSSGTTVTVAIVSNSQMRGRDPACPVPVLKAATTRACT